jgi:hypothetical protein
MVLLADNVVAVTSQMHNRGISFPRSGYCGITAAATAEVSVGKIGNYYFTILPYLSVVLA